MLGSKLLSSRAVSRGQDSSLEEGAVVAILTSPGRFKRRDLGCALGCLLVDGILDAILEVDGASGSVCFIGASAFTMVAS